MMPNLVFTSGIDRRRNLRAAYLGSAVWLLAPLAWIAPLEGSALPEGEGKPLVELHCSGCHGVDRLTRSAGYNSEGEWRRLIATMVELDEPQLAVIAAYLAEHYPENPARRPKLVDGDVDIEIIEWSVPTLGQRARDPVEAPDGSIWWTGMWASLAGRLDPNSGAMKEYRLPPASKPHTIVPDAEGNIWFTGNSNATIGKLDPETGQVTEFNTKAGDPHSAVFHPNGGLYFTAQRAAVIGRLDPDSGELREVASEPRPYGIQVADDGTLWIAFNGINKIGAMNPDSMAIRYYEIPDPRTRIRRLGLDSQGMVWFVNSSLGKIGRLDPESEDIVQWDSPSGAKSHPYALAVIDDVIWYNESGMRPDALVRFEPGAETFQSWAIPSGVGIVRNMWVTEAGDLLIHQSSSNRVGLVRIP